MQIAWGHAKNFWLKQDTPGKTPQTRHIKYKKPPIYQQKQTDAGGFSFILLIANSVLFAAAAIAVATAVAAAMRSLFNIGSRSQL